MTEHLLTFVHGSLDLLLRMFVIMVAIMVVLEVSEGTRAFSAVTRVGRGRPPRGSGRAFRAPTLVGFLFGLAHGGRVIVRDVRRHDLPRRQDFTTRVFLSMVHAVVEDSLIFIALRAGVFWVVVYRIVWAALVTVVLTALATRWLRRRRGSGPAGSLRAALTPAAQPRNLDWNYLV